MKTKLSISFILLIISLLIWPSANAIGKNIDVVSPWVNQAPILNGQTTDWPDQASTFIKEKDVLVRVCNDSQNVYVMLAFRNAQWAGVIKRSGLTVKFDPQAKNKDNFTVKLIDGPSLDQIKALRGKDSTDMDQMPPGMEYRMRGRDQKMEKAFICTKKGYLVDKPIPLDGSQGPAAGFGLANSFFAYEFSIPLGESSARFYGLGIKPGQKISIGFTWGEMEKGKMSGERPSRGGEEGGPPGGGGEGGGMPGGGGGGMGGPGGGGGRGGPGAAPAANPACPKSRKSG